MEDFKIRRGPSTTLFSAPGIVNKRLLIEEGYWYLCTDSAELFLGVKNKNTQELELERVNGKAIPTKLSELLNDCGFLTEIPEDYATKADIADFVTKSGVEAAVKEAVENLEILDVPTKVSDLENDLGYITLDEVPDVDLNEYAKKEELPSIEGLATETFVRNAIAEAELNDKDVDMSGYATKDDLSSLATKAALTAVENKIPSVAGLASTDYVDSAVNSIEIPEVPINISELENDAGYITLADVPETDFSNYYNKTETADLIAEAIGKVEVNIPSVEGFASKTYVDEKVAAVKLPEIPTKLSKFENDAGYLTEQDLGHLAEKEHTHDGYAEKDHVHEQYLTEHQSLDDYAKINDLFSGDYNDLINAPVIPSIDGLATEAFVCEQIEAIELPDIDLKADKVLFTSDRFVSKAVGNFAAGENVNGLTIAQILAKLLELSDAVIEEPEPPVEPNSIVEAIMTNKTPMYAVTSAGTVEEVPYQLLTYTTDNASEPSDESGFYQIKDTAGNIIESGYQLKSNIYLDMPFIITLPKAIDFSSNIEVQTWNDLEKYWETKNIVLSSDVQEFTNIMGQSPYDMFDNVDQDTYTIWFNAEDGSTGVRYRFIIHE